MSTFLRTKLLLGKEATDKLENSKVAVFGIGGVGSFAAEALARTGVFNIWLIDKDVVSITNINRQLVANHNTIGMKKVDVMKQRILEINPEASICAVPIFYGEEIAEDIDLSQFDYIIDAIDTVSSKLTLIERAKKANVKIISSMGAGNKLDPTQLLVSDIYKTSVCALAKVMRKELKARNIESLKVVYSKEQAIPIKEEDENYNDESNNKRKIIGSAIFVPSAFGICMAAEVVKDLTT